MISYTGRQLYKLVRSQNNSSLRGHRPEEEIASFTTGIVESFALDSFTQMPSQSRLRISLHFRPLFLRRSPPPPPLSNSSLRSFTPSTCPMHPIHNADFEDEVLALTPAPLFAGQDRPLRRILPATTVESLLVTFDLLDEIDAILDELLQDGTASRMREAEIAAAEASSQASQESILLPRHGSSQGSSLSTDIWMQKEIFQAGETESADNDSSVSGESDRSSSTWPSIFEYIDVQNQLANFQFKVRRRPRKLSEPISPKTVERHF